MIDLEHLRKTVKGGIFNMNSQKWQEAFSEYNESEHHKLGMKCRGCYHKVLEFHEKKASKAQVS